MIPPNLSQILPPLNPSRLQMVIIKLKICWNEQSEELTKIIETHASSSEIWVL